MVDYKHLRYEKGDRIAKITMDRPRYRNAQSRLLLEEMDNAFASAADDDGVRVVILAGEGEHFSSGHDIGTQEEMDDRKERSYPDGLGGEYQRSWDLFSDMCLRWRDLPKPTIAQVQGYCIYGGWMIASAMDVIVASADARFLPSHFQYFSVPWDIPPRKAKEILWQARFVEADEALELGLVSRVVPREQLEPSTLELAEQIARMDPFAARMVKFSVNQAQDAMGFRTSVQAAHSNYMLIQSSRSRDVPKDERGRPRLPGVSRAFKEQAEATDGEQD
jgi:enoyl-CoA hydratase